MGWRRTTRPLAPSPPLHNMLALPLFLPRHPLSYLHMYVILILPTVCSRPLPLGFLVVLLFTLRPIGLND